MSLPAVRRFAQPFLWMRRGLVLCILALGLGVFLWGTAYKLSLYESSPIHNKIPEAKLLTGSASFGKSSAIADATPDPSTKLPTILPLALFLFILSLPAVCILTMDRSLPQRSLFFSFSPALFLRPPPFLFIG